MQINFFARWRNWLARWSYEPKVVAQSRLEHFYGQMPERSKGGRLRLLAQAAWVRTPLWSLGGEDSLFTTDCERCSIMVGG